MTKYSAGRRLTRKHRVLRYVLRKRPCVYISFCEIACFVFLATSLALSVYFQHRYSKERVFLDEQDRRLSKWTDYITYAHCNFEKGKLDFDTSYCHDRTREQAFAYRLMTLPPDHDPTCLPKFDAMPCHESVMEHVVPSPRKVFSMCAGLTETLFVLGEVKMGEPHVRFPFLNNEDLPVGKEAFVADIYGICPRCRIRTVPFQWSLNAKCFVKLETVEGGWPFQVQSCDTFLSHDATEGQQCLELFNID